MALKWIELSDVDRYCLIKALGKIDKTDLDTARAIREVREQFSLRDFERQMDKLSQICDRFGVGISWDDMIDGLEPVRRRLENAPTKGKRESDVLADASELIELFSTDPRRYTIEQVYLDWIWEDVLKDVNWSKVWVRAPDGSMQSMQVPVPMGLMESYAYLVDRVNRAIASMPIKDQREQEE